MEDKKGGNNMRKGIMAKRVLSVVLAGSLLAGGVAAGNAGISEAAKSVYLKNKSFTLDLNAKTIKKIKVKKAKGIRVKKVEYKSKNKKIAAVSKAGKVTAKSAGSTEISVKVTYQKKKKSATRTLLCRVTVKSGTSPESEEKEPVIETQPTAEVYEDGDVKAVKAVLPERTKSSSEGKTGITGPDNGWKKEVSAWQEKEKQVDMKKYYMETLRCFLSGEKSTVYSPINIYMALSMLAEAGSGETQQEILNLLQVQDTDTLREHIHALWNANYYDADSASSLLGNSLWLNNRVNYNETLLKTLAEYYHASSFSGTMGSEKYNQAVRNWVNEYTKDLLKDSVQEISLPKDAVMDIISTIYFKAGWLDSFEKSATKKQVFHGKSGDKKVDMMHQSKKNGVYMADKFTGLSLGLSAGKMHFILPKEGVALSDVVADEEVMDMIGVGNVDAKKKSEKMAYAKINMSIPKFRLQSKINLSEGLKSLGVVKAFDADTADFRSIFADPSSGENAYVSDASHAAMVEVDEDGVTGAAYTEFMMVATSALEKKTIDFVLDRPFYYIVTADDGSILFAGTVYDI